MDQDIQIFIAKVSDLLQGIQVTENSNYFNSLRRNKPELAYQICLSILTSDYISTNLPVCLFTAQTLAWLSIHRCQVIAQVGDVLVQLLKSSLPKVLESQLLLSLSAYWLLVHPPEAHVSILRKIRQVLTLSMTVEVLFASNEITKSNEWTKLAKRLKMKNEFLFSQSIIVIEVISIFDSVLGEVFQSHASSIVVDFDHLRIPLKSNLYIRSLETCVVWIQSSDIIDIWMDSSIFKVVAQTHFQLVNSFGRWSDDDVQAALRLHCELATVTFNRFTELSRESPLVVASTAFHEYLRSTLSLCVLKTQSLLAFEPSQQLAIVSQAVDLESTDTLPFLVVLETLSELVGAMLPMATNDDTVIQVAIEIIKRLAEAGLTTSISKSSIRGKATCLEINRKVIQILLPLTYRVTVYDSIGQGKENLNHFSTAHLHLLMNSMSLIVRDAIHCSRVDQNGKEFRLFLREELREIAERMPSFATAIYEETMMQLADAVSSCERLFICEAWLHACSALTKAIIAESNDETLIRYVNSLVSRQVVNSRFLARVVVPVVADALNELSLRLAQCATHGRCSDLVAAVSSRVIECEVTALAALVACVFHVEQVHVTNPTTTEAFTAPWMPFRLKEDHIGVVSLCKALSVVVGDIIRFTNSTASYEEIITNFQRGSESVSAVLSRGDHTTRIGVDRMLDCLTFRWAGTASSEVSTSLVLYIARLLGTLVSATEYVLSLDANGPVTLMTAKSANILAQMTATAAVGFDAALAVSALGMKVPDSKGTLANIVFIRLIASVLGGANMSILDPLDRCNFICDFLAAAFDELRCEDFGTDRPQRVLGSSGIQHRPLLLTILRCAERRWSRRTISLMRGLREALADVASTAMQSIVSQWQPAFWSRETSSQSLNEAVRMIARFISLVLEGPLISVAVVSTEALVDAAAMIEAFIVRCHSLATWFEALIGLGGVWYVTSKIRIAVNGGVARGIASWDYLFRELSQADEEAALSERYAAFVHPANVNGISELVIGAVNAVNQCSSDDRCRLTHDLVDAIEALTFVRGAFRDLVPIESVKDTMRFVCDSIVRRISQTASTETDAVKWPSILRMIEAVMIPDSSSQLVETIKDDHLAMLISIVLWTGLLGRAPTSQHNRIIELLWVLGRALGSPRAAFCVLAALTQISQQKMVDSPCLRGDDLITAVAGEFANMFAEDCPASVNKKLHSLAKASVLNII